MSRSLRYRIHPDPLAVCQLPAGTAVPEWAAGAGFTSITATGAELSIVCAEARVPEGIRAQGGWLCFELEGPFEFTAAGILAAFVQPLADAQVPVFAVSTYNTDWVLIPSTHRDRAVRALAAARHNEI